MSPTRLTAKIMHGDPSGPDVTWAGANPFAEGLLFGFDNGTCVALAERTGQSSTRDQLSPSGEAINGIAAIGSASLAVSTRADVSFYQKKDPANPAVAVFPGGAHGVIATRGGYFVAPRGPAGLLVVKPTSEDLQRMIVTKRNESRLYFSRIASVSGRDSKEILVCANRRNGVGMSVFDGEDTRREVFTLKFEDIDIIDVCSISSDSMAAIAISMAAEVLWINDASTRNHPLAMKLNGVEGPVYRVLATDRDLFVLSSKALYIWTGLVDRVLFGGTSAIVPRPLVLPVEAVDMALIQDGRLLLVMGANAVMSLTLSGLERGSTEGFGSDSLVSLSEEMARRTGLEELKPRWQSAEYEQRMLAGASQL